MAKYYALIEDGCKPTNDWSIRNEAYEDNAYRARSAKATKKEESDIIEAGQELFDAKDDQDKIDELVGKYTGMFPPHMRF